MTPTPTDIAAAQSTERVKKALRYFDATGQMQSWPAKQSQQALCLWAIWCAIPPGERFDEAEINRFITEAHTFGDHAILRRSLVDAGMLARTPEGRLYRRIEVTPDTEASALLDALDARVS